MEQTGETSDMSVTKARITCIHALQGKAEHSTNLWQSIDHWELVMQICNLELSLSEQTQVAHLR